MLLPTARYIYYQAFVEPGEYMVIAGFNLFLILNFHDVHAFKQARGLVIRGNALTLATPRPSLSITFV